MDEIEKMINREGCDDDYDFFKTLLDELRFFAHWQGVHPDDSDAMKHQTKTRQLILTFVAELMLKQSNTEVMVDRLISAGDIALDFPHVDDGIEAKAIKDWMVAREEWNQSKKAEA